jgi:SAM-dependent methyltransferase
MPVHIKNCPICTSNRLRFFETCFVGNEEIPYHICSNCGAVFQPARMGEVELQAFYEQGYRTLYQETEEPTTKDLVMQEERAKRTLTMIQAHVERVQRHLDIGSSSGALIVEVQQAYGCESVGIEPGDVYREFSKRQDLQVFPSLRVLPTQMGPFDLISMMHVLEHLPDPVKTLREMRIKHMTPNGYLLVEVPNLIEHNALELAHPFAFTPATLAETVRRGGFEVLWIKSHGSFRSPVLKLYITLLATVANDPARKKVFLPLPQWIKTRRRIGRLKRDVLTKLLPDWTWQSPPKLWADDK